MQRFFEKYQIDDKVIAAGVSGGADSLALVLRLHEWAGGCGRRVVALTVDHGLRPESSREAQYVAEVMRELPAEDAAAAEKKYWEMSHAHALPSCRLQLLRSLIPAMRSTAMTDTLYGVWERQTEPLLSENDYTTLSYELALRMPGQYSRILETQRKRIENPDRLRQFDFISRAVNPDTGALDSLFASLKDKDNRRIEPWTATVLGYLNHPLREAHAVKYIYPGLDLLQEVQRTCL